VFLFVSAWVSYPFERSIAFQHLGSFVRGETGALAGDGALQRRYWDRNEMPKNEASRIETTRPTRGTLTGKFAQAFDNTT
jgi:hypothetical protein